MYSVKIFNTKEYTPDRSLITPQMLSHCKRDESIFSALTLTEMGAVGLYYDKNGKPLADNCFVSVSHSGSLVAVCLGDLPLGIDIERPVERPNRLNIAQRLFKGKELLYYYNNENLEGFYTVWTRKEAFAKIDGQGLSKIKKGFDTYSLTDVTFKTHCCDDYIVSVCEQIKRL